MPPNDSITEIQKQIQIKRLANLPQHKKDRLKELNPLELEEELQKITPTRDEILYQAKKDFGYSIARNNMRKADQAHNSGCFVATACYGNVNAPEVQILREWRDSVLSQGVCGRFFIKYYYLLGPSFANWIIKHPRLLIHVRKALDGFIHGLNNMQP